MRHAQSGKEFVVGDVLLLGRYDPAGDLELFFLRSVTTGDGDDAVVLAGEQCRHAG